MSHKKIFWHFALFYSAPPKCRLQRSASGWKWPAKMSGVSWRTSAAPCLHPASGWAWCWTMQKGRTMALFRESSISMSVNSSIITKYIKKNICLTFQCEENCGMFVRLSQLTFLDDAGHPMDGSPGGGSGSPSSTTSGSTPTGRGSRYEHPWGSRRINNPPN